MIRKLDTRASSLSVEAAIAEDSDPRQKKRHSKSHGNMAGTLYATEMPRHVIDHRASIRLLGRRYYIRLLVGPESRNALRLSDEGQISLAKAVAIMLMIAWLALPMVAFIIVLGLYALKSFIGIDLFDGSSFLHPLFYY